MAGWRLTGQLTVMRQVCQIARRRRSLSRLAVEVLRERSERDCHEPHFILQAFRRLSFLALLGARPSRPPARRSISRRMSSSARRRSPSARAARLRPLEFRRTAECRPGPVSARTLASPTSRRTACSRFASQPPRSPMARRPTWCSARPTSLLPPRIVAVRSRPTRCAIPGHGRGPVRHALCHRLQQQPGGRLTARRSRAAWMPPG